MSFIEALGGGVAANKLTEKDGKGKGKGKGALGGVPKPVLIVAGGAGVYLLYKWYTNRNSSSTAATTTGSSGTGSSGYGSGGGGGGWWGTGTNYPGYPTNPGTDSTQPTPTVSPWTGTAPAPLIPAINTIAPIISPPSSSPRSQPVPESAAKPVNSKLVTIPVAGHPGSTVSAIGIPTPSGGLITGTHTPVTIHSPQGTVTVHNGNITASSPRALATAPTSFNSVPSNSVTHLAQPNPYASNPAAYVATNVAKAVQPAPNYAAAPASAPHLAQPNPYASKPAAYNKPAPVQKSSPAPKKSSFTAVPKGNKGGPANGFF